MALLSEKIQNIIIEKIQNKELLLGDKVPPVREISKKFNVSYVTAAKAIKMLGKLGYIESMPGRGTFVSRPEFLKDASLSAKRRVLKKVYFLFSDRSAGNESYQMEIFAGVASKMQDNGIRIELKLQYDEKWKNSILKEKDIGIILADGSDDIQEDLIKHNIPTVVIDSKSEYITASICPNYIEGSEEIVNYLLSKGHKKIIFVDAYTSSSIHLYDHFAGYQKAMLNKDLPVLTPVKWHYLKAKDEIYNIIKEIKDRKPNAPTALFAGNDRMASEIIQTALDAGLNIPADLSIVGFGDMFSPNTQEFKITTMGYDKKNLGIESVTLLLKISKAGSNIATRISNPMFLKEGKTVRKIN